MAPMALRLVPLLLGGYLAAFSDLQFVQPLEYKTPNCALYHLPICPRTLSPVCGSDMNTYPNECTLCVQIREDGQDIKIIRDEPC